MTKRKIDCESCGFNGSLTYKDGDFTKADISYCPACGGDISEDYNVSDDEMESNYDE